MHLHCLDKESCLTYPKSLESFRCASVQASQISKVLTAIEYKHMELLHVDSSQTQLHVQSSPTDCFALIAYETASASRERDNIILAAQTLTYAVLIGILPFKIMFCPVSKPDISSIKTVYCVLIISVVLNSASLTN